MARRKLQHDRAERAAKDDQRRGGLHDLPDFPALERQAEKDCRLPQ